MALYPPGHGAPPPAASSRRHVVALAGAVVLLCLLSLALTAPRHAATSPSAQRLAALLPPSPFTSLSSPLSSSLRDDTDLSYRRAIERTTAPHYRGANNKPWFDHVYVLSLPSRQDRRRDMRRLADALGIDVEFVDAANKDEPFIQWIAERVKESRDLRRDEMVSPTSLSLSISLSLSQPLCRGSP